MAENEKPQIGSLGWVDLTVADAEKSVEFYKSVVGWEVEKFAMDGYSDYIMKIKGSDIPVAGICNAKGENKDFPPVWLTYFTVANLNDSIENCIKLGGSVLIGPKNLADYGTIAIIKDNAGVICALFEHLK